MEIEKEIQDLKIRNKKVGLDKAWETSWTRRISIAIITYVIATIWLCIIKEKNMFLKAVIPTAGYILSTITLPLLKNIWIKDKL